MHQDRADAARARITDKFRKGRRALIDDCKRDLDRARAHLRTATELIQQVAAKLYYEQRLLDQEDTTIAMQSLPPQEPAQ